MAADLPAGTRLYQSPLWQTNAALLTSLSGALLCDPALTPAEIQAIKTDTAQIAGPITILITHADFDHVCGIPAFPEAVVIVGVETAEAIDSGKAGEALGNAGPYWGIAWETALRYDRIARPGERFACDGLSISVVDASSHGREGIGYLVEDIGVLFVGDNASSITYPLLGGSLQVACDATATLVATIDETQPTVVVPGHGPVHTTAEARTIAQADRRYLTELQGRAAEAIERELSPGYALLHVYGVEPPRPSTPDFEIYDIRAANARLALAQAGVS